MRRPQRNNIVPKRKFAVVASRDNGECLFRSLLSATFAGGQPRNPPESVLAAGVAGLKQDIHKRVCASSRLRQVLRDTQDIEPTAGNFGPVGRADLVSASSYCSVRSPLFATSFYGGELELMVAADVLGVTVAVVTEASQTAYVVMSVYGKGPAVVWLRLGGNHYDWLYPKSDIARSFRPPPGSSRASRRRTPKAKLRRKYAHTAFGSPSLAANTSLMNNAQRELARQFKGTTAEARNLLANLGHAELARDGQSPATVKGLAAMAMEAL